MEVGPRNKKQVLLPISRYHRVSTKGTLFLRKKSPHAVDHGWPITDLDPMNATRLNDEMFIDEKKFSTRWRNLPVELIADLLGRISNIRQWKSTKKRLVNSFITIISLRKLNFFN